MVIRPLEIQNAYATYDETTRIVHVTYRGSLDSEVSSAVYEWLNRLIEMVGAEAIFGQIWDFRNVDQFMPDNLQDARKNSRIMNLKQNTGRFPVAMVGTSACSSGAPAAASSGSVFACLREYGPGSSSSPGRDASFFMRLRGSRPSGIKCSPR